MTQGGEGDAEAVASGFERALRPEEIDEDLAGVHLVAVISQIGQKRPDLLRFEAGDKAIPLLDLQPPSSEMRIGSVMVGQSPAMAIQALADHNGV